ncbi:23S rRNA (guanosine(2251)-2'-O)-methyltransferase RlmB [Youngiibacter multivorans]|uniref:23S rRNA (Guanosine2251-2'-O)-methyltransferase n=1 Tax=Youngiibacter multivorans TaxID=937251 RepID=A0ABS4G3N2_9CLOT|nr:23S rRNA (guanosine(2251)-2'-O)-methyltransferase RlmB [Youngiibacter multivorans]MBP1919155.1 23S rRNA (guanosine2251-2'-O)-methyltransferase [Youngiibacter multivorans]
MAKRDGLNFDRTKKKGAKSETQVRDAARKPVEKRQAEDRKPASERKPAAERKPFADRKPAVEVEINENIVAGRNAVLEVLDSKLTVEKILVASGDTSGSINKIIPIAKEKGIPVIEVDRRKLDNLSQGESHQGVIAYVTPYRYSEVKDILDKAAEKGEKPFILVLDEIEDPHNLGSIIRTAELSGVHGVIIPKRRSASVNSTVYKTSAGAVNHMLIAKVSNLAREVDELKEAGIFVYGADMDGDSASFATDFSGGVALIIGNEGKGISRLLKEKCDSLVSIPMVGKINSLNASVAAGILMYEVMVQRLPIED